MNVAAFVPSQGNGGRSRVCPVHPPPPRCCSARQQMPERDSVETQGTGASRSWLKHSHGAVAGEASARWWQHDRHTFSEPVTWQWGFREVEGEPSEAWELVWPTLRPSSHRTHMTPAHEATCPMLGPQPHHAHPHSHLWDSHTSFVGPAGPPI